MDRRRLVNCTDAENESKLNGPKQNENYSGRYLRSGDHVRKNSHVDKFKLMYT